MPTPYSPTDPRSTTIHGPAGSYTVVFRGHHQPDAIRGLSSNGPRPCGPQHYSAGFSITDGYTVANNDTFRRIIEILGWKVDSIDGLLHPEGHTIWL